MKPEYMLDPQEMMTEILVLNEALSEAEEFTEALRLEITRLTQRNRMLEKRLISYNISFEDIDSILDAE